MTAHQTAREGKSTDGIASAIPASRPAAEVNPNAVVLNRTTASGVTRCTFEPGHTAAEFRARHMMITWVRGLFPDIHGSLEFDRDNWMLTSFEGVIEAARLWTGEPNRDAHLRSADFLDVEHHPQITFKGRLTELLGATQGRASTNLTIRGVTRPVTLDVIYQGEWETPFWVGDENKGMLRRIGFSASTRINRHDFGVSWQGQLPGGGIVVSNDVLINIDAEAILDEDLERTGAIEYYRASPRSPESGDDRSPVGV